jgi:hypothetical protein
MIGPYDWDEAFSQNPDQPDFDVPPSMITRLPAARSEWIDDTHGAAVYISHN